MGPSRTIERPTNPPDKATSGIWICGNSATVTSFGSSAFFLQTRRAVFCIIRPAKIRNLFRLNDLRILPFCFLQPKPPFSSFFRIIRALFATRGVALFPASGPSLPAFPRPLSAFPCPLLQTDFTTSGVNYAKTQLRGAPCKIPIVQTAPLQNSHPRRAQPPRFPV